MKKVKVAFIDDEINEDVIKKLYKNIKITKINLTNKNVIWKNKLSHATMCALILLDHFIDIEILDIVAFTNAEDTKIDIIKKSLNICLMEKVDILCLSIGNSSNKVGKQLSHIITKLRENNMIIIAANNNTDEITFPAALDEVIGIKHDKSMMLSNGNYAYISKPLDGINIYTNIPLNTIGTNYIINQNKNFSLDSNSFASPYIASLISKWLLEGYNSNNILNAISYNSIDLQNYNTFYKRNILNYTKNILNNSIIVFCENEKIISILNKKLNANFYTSIICGRHNKKCSNFIENYFYISSDYDYLDSINYISNILNPSIIFITKKDKRIICDFEISESNRIISYSSLNTNKQFASTSLLYKYIVNQFT